MYVFSPARWPEAAPAAGCARPAGSPHRPQGIWQHPHQAQSSLQSESSEQVEIWKLSEEDCWLDIALIILSMFAVLRGYGLECGCLIYFST